MKHRVSLAALCVSISLLAACAPAPSAPESSSQEASFTGQGTWGILCSDYEPVSYDLCQAVSFPRFQDKDRQAWEDYSVSIGKVDGEFLVWAEGGTLSPDGSYLAYHTSKDCLESGGLSVFLLDMRTNTEQALLSGGEGVFYSIQGWLDDSTLLCMRSAPGANNAPTQYWMVGPNRGAVQLPLDGVQIFAQRGRLLLQLLGEQQNTLELVYVGADGRVTQRALQTVQGYPVNGGAISPDGRLVAFPLRPSWQSPDRNVCVWDTQTGAVVTLDNPQPATGSNPAAISPQWGDSGLQVDFNVENPTPPNSHNELWQYTFS